MRTTLLSMFALLTAFAVDCHAADWFKGTPLNNTPIDLPSWRIGRSPDTSHLPVETYAPRGTSNRWDYRDGRFEFRGNGRWIELRRNGHPSHFVEIGRNQRIVDLYDRDRRMFVRLTPTDGLFRRHQSEPWARWGNGNFR
ncbi:MAG: hypothetical protein AB7I30_21520 [Isosphaeraceae bacterium]